MNSTNRKPLSAHDQQLHILLVDDDEYLCELMAAMLNELAVDSVKVATSGKHGLDIYTAAELKPNLLLCDLCMPGMDGFQFLSKMAAKSYRRLRNLLKSARLASAWRQICDKAAAAFNAPS